MDDNKSTVDKHTGLKGATYIQTKLNAETCHEFDIPTFDELYLPTMKDHPFYTYHNKPFSKERLMYSTIPLHIGPFNITFDKQQIVNVLRCPIKVSGNRKIILPNELLFLKEYIEFCCIYETCFNERFDDMYIHMTVDYKEFKSGETHRVPGWHVDGFQGCKFPEKHEIEHSYLWTSDLGTEFCVQPFFVDKIDDSKYLIFDEFGKQARESNIYKCLSNNVYIFDPYMVHRSPVATNDTHRLLVRLTFEYQKLLDPNDTQNPKIQFTIPYKYDIRNRLGEYKIPLNLESYGFRQ